MVNNDRHAIADMKAELEKIRREARELKAAESQAKAAMQREERKQVKTEKEREGAELADWRLQQRDDTMAFAAERKMQQQIDDLEDSREYQAYKRHMREVEQEQNLEDVHQAYLEAKDNAAHNAEMKREEQAERNRLPVEENLEKYRTVAEARLQERQEEELEAAEARQSHEQFELEHRMLLAREERDEALRSLEFTRSHHFAPAPEGHDLIVR